MVRSIASTDMTQPFTFVRCPGGKIQTEETYRYPVLDGVDEVEQRVVLVVLDALLDLELAGLRELGQDVLFCSVPQVPGLGAVKVLIGGGQKEGKLRLSWRIRISVKILNFKGIQLKLLEKRKIK